MFTKMPSDYILFRAYHWGVVKKTYEALDDFAEVRNVPEQSSLNGARMKRVNDEVCVTSWFQSSRQLLGEQDVG